MVTTPFVEKKLLTTEKVTTSDEVHKIIDKVTTSEEVLKVLIRFTEVLRTYELDALPICQVRRFFSTKGVVTTAYFLSSKTLVYLSTNDMIYLFLAFSSKIFDSGHRSSA